MSTYYIKKETEATFTHLTFMDITLQVAINIDLMIPTLFFQLDEMLFAWKLISTFKIHMQIVRIRIIYWLH